jgi:hypothetical protein
VSAEPLAPDRSSRGRLPDFFVVGHPKCGTTALYEMLRSHPQIHMPALKEPRFFADDLRRRREGSRQGRLPHTLDQYMALFAGARSEQRAGEATPLYLMSRVAAARISTVAPAARIVAILREPAGFLRSLHLQLVKAHVEPHNDLRRALALEPARRQGRRMPRGLPRPQLLLYSEHVRYVEQLRRFHAAFAAERVLVLIYDDFRADNTETVRRVLRFLEVDDAHPIDAVRANPTVQVRSVRADGLVHAVSFGRGRAARTAKATIKALAPQRQRQVALRAVQRHLLWREPPPPDERLALELRRRFRSEVVALSEYLGRDLVALWGYDRLD